MEHATTVPAGTWAVQGDTIRLGGASPQGRGQKYAKESEQVVLQMQGERQDARRARV